MTLLTIFFAACFAEVCFIVKKKKKLNPAPEDLNSV